MSRYRKLTLETLEDRAVPATFGVPWPNPGHLTLSFAPDGTQVGDQPSQLFRLLNAVAPTSVWQGAILRAFQDWAAPTNINLSVVPDSGDPLGAVGPLQGDPRFGDIRVTAVPLPADVVGEAIPFDVTAGSWAGDVELNSNDLFGVGGAAPYDLLTVALHEAGHSLGIDDGTDPASPMNATYVGPRTGLTAGDVGAIQALYGPRRPDAFDANSPNDTLATATPLNLSLGGNGLAPTVVDANITTPADADVYSFKPGNNQTALTFQVQTGGFSLLSPSLTFYSPAGAVLASATATDPGHGDLSVRLSGLQVGATYFVKVAAGTADAFGAGSYRLQIVPDGATPVSGGTAGGVTVLPNDAHTNDTIGTATDLRQSAFQNDVPYAFACQAAVTDATDVDYYRLRTPQGPNGTTTVMRVLVWGTEVGGLDPSVSVFDAHGNAVAGDVLVNENGSYVLQVPGAQPNADYYVSVRAERPGGPHNVGGYFLGAGFSGNPVSLQTFTGGTLTQASRNDFRTLQVNQSQLFHLVLAANSGAVPVATAVKMTVYDLGGNAVASVTALNGESQSLTVFLAPGTYTVRFAGGTADGSPLPATSYSLRGLNLSDPIGPQTTDPTLTPAPPPPPDPSQTDLSFYWLQYGYYAALATTDPAGYPSF
jgi:hypothetical protein